MLTITAHENPPVVKITLPDREPYLIRDYNEAMYLALAMMEALRVFPEWWKDNE